jgi:hypothetical protein
VLWLIVGIMILEEIVRIIAWASAVALAAFLNRPGFAGG